MVESQLNCTELNHTSRPSHSSKTDCWWKYYQQTSRILPGLLCENSGETRGCRLRPSLGGDSSDFTTSVLSIWAYRSIVRRARQVEESYFFAEFEHLYQESQKIAPARQNGIGFVEVDCKGRFKRLTRRWRFLDLSFLQDPKTIRLTEQAAPSWPMFTLRHVEKVVTYQLSLGNGKIKASVPASIPIESLVALGLFHDYDLIIREIRCSRKERLWISKR